MFIRPRRGIARVAPLIAILCALPPAVLLAQAAASGAAGTSGPASSPPAKAGTSAGEASVTISWSAVEGAGGYTIELTTLDGQAVTAVTVTGTTATLNAPPGSYLVRVVSLNHFMRAESASPWKRIAIVRKGKPKVDKVEPATVEPGTMGTGPRIQLSGRNLDASTAAALRRDSGGPAIRPLSARDLGNGRIELSFPPIRDVGSYTLELLNKPDYSLRLPGALMVTHRPAVIAAVTPSSLELTGRKERFSISGSDIAPGASLSLEGAQGKVALSLISRTEGGLVVETQGPVSEGNYDLVVENDPLSISRAPSALHFVQPSAPAAAVAVAPAAVPSSTVPAATNSSAVPLSPSGPPPSSAALSPSSSAVSPGPSAVPTSASVVPTQPSGAPTRPSAVPPSTVPEPSAMPATAAAGSVPKDTASTGIAAGSVPETAQTVAVTNTAAPSSVPASPGAVAAPSSTVPATAATTAVSVPPSTVPEPSATPATAAAGSSPEASLPAPELIEAGDAAASEAEPAGESFGFKLPPDPWSLGSGWAPVFALGNWGKLLSPSLASAELDARLCLKERKLGGQTELRIGTVLSAEAFFMATKKNEATYVDSKLSVFGLGAGGWLALDWPRWEASIRGCAGAAYSTIKVSGSALPQDAVTSDATLAPLLSLGLELAWKQSPRLFIGLRGSWDLVLYSDGTLSALSPGAFARYVF